MRHIILIGCLAILVLAGLTGCSSPPTRVTTPKEVECKSVKLEDLHNRKIFLPDNDTAIDLLSKAGGVFYFSDGNELIVFIGLGQRNTAGFGIKVKSIKTSDAGASYDVTVEEIKPASGNFVAQVITYPYVLVNLGSVNGPKEISVRDEQGNKFNHLSYYVDPPRIQVLEP